VTRRAALRSARCRGAREDDRERAAGPALRLAVLLLGTVLAAPALAQDADVDPFLIALERFGSVESAHATTYQIYRVPLSYTLREPAGGFWGLALTFPVSLGANELTASTGVGDFFERIQTLTVAPGFELRIPLGPVWLLKPYTEAGFRGTSLGGSADTTLALGVRSIATWRAGITALTLGLSGRYASPRTHRDLIDDYSSFEAGLDAQLPLGFSVAGHAMSGGVYGVTRYFPSFRLAGAPEVSLGWTQELGISVSAAPTVSILGVTVPWVGLGYRFGDAFSGVRLNLSFPF
jgi:hypothetical protein